MKKILLILLMPISAYGQTLEEYFAKHDTVKILSPIMWTSCYGALKGINTMFKLGGASGVELLGIDTNNHITYISPKIDTARWDMVRKIANSKAWTGYSDRSFWCKRYMNSVENGDSCEIVKIINYSDVPKYGLYIEKELSDDKREIIISVIFNQILIERVKLPYRKNDYPTIEDDRFYFNEKYFNLFTAH